MITLFLILGLMGYLVLPIAALIWIARLASNLRDQEKQIAQLTGIIRAMGAGNTIEQPPRPNPPAVPVTGPAVAQPSSQRASVPTAPQPERRHAAGRSKEEWEALIGGKLLNRIGALALIIGVGFFLKYASDRNWISDPVRVLMGGVAGGTLLGFASRSHKRGFQVFSQGLVGAGIAILYLSVYAAYDSYHLLSQPVALVVMSAVTTVAFTQAFRYTSVVVALLGWLGGFLTPFLLASGRNDPVGLFSYIALLDIGLLAVLVLKDEWAVLEPLAILATWITFSFWRGRYYTPDDLVTAGLFLTLFWVLFHWLGSYRILQGRRSYEVARRCFGVFNIVLFYPTLYNIVNASAHEWMGLVTFGIATIYFGTALILLRKQPAFEVSTMIFIVTSIVLLAVATWIQFAGFTIVSVWAIEASLLVWCGVRWKKRWVWLAALGLFGLAVLKAALTPGFLHLQSLTAIFLFNPRGYALAALAAGFAFSAHFFGRLEHTDAFISKRSLQYGWITALFLLISVEISDHFLRLIAMGFGEQKPNLAMARNMFLAAAWMLYSMPLLWFGLKRQIPPLFLSGIGMISISIGLGGIWSMTYSPIEQFTPFTNIRAGLLAFLILGTLLHTQWLAGVRRRYHRLEALMHFTWGLLLFEFCTVETNDYFRRAMEFATSDVRVSLTFGRFLTLAAVWMVFSLPIVRLGLARKMRPTLYLGLWALLLSISMAAVRGISFQPIENYTFLLNFRSVILALVVVGSFVHLTWIRYSGQLFGILYEVLNSLRAATVILILVLLTAETRDYFEKQIYLLNSGLTASSAAVGVTQLENLKQVCLSSVWLIYSIALMVIGIWKRNRTFRFFAIGLFVITIAKVFFYDLSFLETLYRIFSFVGLGLILLAVSYLYQRYKSIILEPSPPPEMRGKEDIIL